MADVSHYDLVVVTLFGFFLSVLRDMHRGLREMQQLTREVEALLDKGVSRQA